MNDNQKEKLLKLAETNPELAKEMLDIFKDEKPASQEPIAVKVVKAEEDKLTFTEEQKKWAIGYVAFIIIGMLIILLGIVLTLVVFNNTRYDYIFAPVFFISVVSSFAASYYCAYRVGMPTIKQFMSRHCTFLKG
jgi:hypothetical protein